MKSLIINTIAKFFKNLFTNFTILITFSTLIKNESAETVCKEIDEKQNPKDNSSSDAFKNGKTEGEDGEIEEKEDEEEELSSNPKKTEGEDGEIEEKEDEEENLTPAPKTNSLTEGEDGEIEEKEDKEE